MNSQETAEFDTSLDQVKIQSVYERAVELGSTIIESMAELFAISEEHPYIAGNQIRKIVDKIPSQYISK